MIKFTSVLKHWKKPNFAEILSQEIAKLDTAQLPLQKALTQSSYVSDSNINITILNASEDENDITIKTGVFFAGIIAGSCCSDDPTPVDEIQEYGELEFKIDKKSAETTITLLTDG